jgi:hypothetical protein
LVIPAAALAAVAFIAGYPAQIECDLPDNGDIMGFALPGAPALRMQPYLCANLGKQPWTPQFVQAIATVIHESAHLKGVKSETCAEWYAVAGIYDVLRRFYGIPFFSPFSRQIGNQALMFARSLGPTYQPDPTSCQPP